MKNALHIELYQLKQEFDTIEKIWSLEKNWNIPDSSFLVSLIDLRIPPIPINEVNDYKNLPNKREKVISLQRDYTQSFNQLSADIEPLINFLKNIENKIKNVKNESVKSNPTAIEITKTLSLAVKKQLEITQNFKNAFETSWYFYELNYQKACKLFIPPKNMVPSSINLSNSIEQSSSKTCFKDKTSFTGIWSTNKIQSDSSESESTELSESLAFLSETTFFAQDTVVNESNTDDFVNIDPDFNELKARRIEVIHRLKNKVANSNQRQKIYLRPFITFTTDNKDIL